jgi:uncharacterized protein
VAGPVENMLAKKVWAVVGATENTQKFGYKIAVFLQKKGYKVYGVNPNTKTINNIPCYPDLASLPEKPDVVNFVVPPPVTARVVAEGLAQGIGNYWVQPGAGDDAVMEMLMRSGTETVFNHCVMAEIHRIRMEGIKENLKKITKLGG